MGYVNLPVQSGSAVKNSSDQLRDIAAHESEEGINFKIIESGGRQLKKRYRNQTLLPQAAVKTPDVWPAKMVGGRVETAGGPILSTSSSASCAHLATKLSTLASLREISSLEQWNMTQTIEKEEKPRSC